MSTNLLVLAGVPGCGKSTWASSLLRFKYSIVSSDEIRKQLAGSLKDAHGSDVKPWDEYYRRIEDRLVHGIDVVADATNLTQRHRRKTLELGRVLEAKCHLVLFKNVLEADIRNDRRDEDSRVPSSVMEDMHRLYYDSLADIAQEEWDSVLKVEAYR